MFNISGFGLTVSIIASNTFPVGVLLTNFSDDQDAITFTDMEIAQAEVGLNGDLITWTKGASVKMALSVIPDSPSDLQLATLLAANRVSRNKISARDTMQMAVIQGNNNTGAFVNGVIVSGPPFNGVQSSSRMKTKTYNFVFETYYAL